ncbi:MAG: flippase-like domain-containing protein [Firmicutes bacterium]|nr:flippase-like domain-containing protein [Bacillota bacterium]
MKDDFASARDIRRKALWAVLFVFIAAGSIWAVFSASKDLSPRDFLLFLKNASPVYLGIAVLSMFGFIIFEGLAVRCLIKAFGFSCTVRDSMVYGASDIYFSAITPSATGGQPACAFFMLKSGIPLTLTSVILLMNLAMYTLSIIVLGVMNLIVHPPIFQLFSTLGRILIIIGFGVQSLLFLSFLIILRKDQWLLSFGHFLINLLLRCRILRDREKWEDRLERNVAEYKLYADLIRGHEKALWKCFFFNFLQRACQLAVTAFTYLATIAVPGEAHLPVVTCISRALSLFGAQSLISIGATFIPIPGAMGVTDMMMVDAFRSVIDPDRASALALLSRSISFYGCVFLALIIVIIAYLRRKKEGKL